MKEIKYRGPLTKRQLEQVVPYLKKKWTSIQFGYEKAIYFDTSIFPHIGDFETGFSRLSLKSDGQGTAFRIKDGNPSDTKRNEIAVAIRKRQVRSLMYILNRLGLQNGYVRPCYRQKFTKEGIIISIKTECVMGDHFEIELEREDLINDPPLQVLIKIFKMKCWAKEQYKERIHKKMKKFPAVNVYKLLSEQSDFK